MRIGGRFFKALAPIYMELLFCLLVAAYGTVGIVVNGVGDLNDRYQVYLQRGLWEDVMISPAKAAVFEAPREKPVRGLKAALGDTDYTLACIRRIKASVDIRSVTFEQKDISRVHGRLDVWLKAYDPCGHRPEFLADLRPDQVVLSRNLAGKLGIGEKAGPSGVSLCMGVHDPPVLQTFAVAGMVDAGGRYPIVYLNPGVLADLGYASGFNVIGLTFPSDAPDAMKPLIRSAAGEDCEVLTAREMEARTAPEQQRVLDQTFDAMTGAAPLILMGLFSIVVFLNFHYTCRLYLRHHATEVWLLRHFGLPGPQRLWLFLLRHVGIVLAGVLASFAAALLILDAARHWGLAGLLMRLDMGVGDMILQWRVLAVCGFLLAAFCLHGGVLFVFHEKKGRP